MKRSIGIFLLLIFVCIISASLSDRFLIAANIENILRRTALFGILSIGVVFVIISAGIDLSIGSVVCLVGCLLPWLVVRHELIGVEALGILFAAVVLIGLLHGALITKIRLQPFVVTLCGLLMYRGLARSITLDQTQGFGTAFDGWRVLATGRIALPFFDSFALPVPLIIFLVLSLLAAGVLNKMTFGRYLLAIGRNEQAARVSGVPVATVVTAAYVICALLAGLGGMLFVLDINSAQPSDFGNFYELYAIAAAVLGGCTVRGGEGSIFGVMCGAALMQVLRNAITLLDIPTQMEFAIIGGVILIGVTVDELVRKSVRQRGV